MQTAHEQVRALLGEMRDISRLAHADWAIRRSEELSDSIETITRAYMDPGESLRDWGVHLSRKEQQIAAILHKRLGCIVTRNSLMDALYFDDPNGGPDGKIVDVFVCKLRKKLIGSGFMIKSIHGIGYSMHEGEAEPRPIAGAVRWGNSVVMGVKQAAVADILKASMGRIVSYVQMGEAGFEYQLASSTIEHLRRKLKGHYTIETIRGMGWRMRNDTPKPLYNALDALSAAQ